MSYYEEKKKKDQARAEWLAGLKVGDKWRAVACGSRFGRTKAVAAIEIEGETKTQFTISYTISGLVSIARFCKSDGLLIRGVSNNDRISEFGRIKGPATEEELLSAMIDELREAIAHSLSGNALLRLDVPALAAVAAAIGLPCPGELAAAALAKGSDFSPK